MSIPKKMKAITLMHSGGPDVLRVASVDVPQPIYKQILIKIRLSLL